MKCAKCGADAPQPEGGESKPSAEIYFAGIDDAISYLGGCTFGASEMSTVRGVLSLLKAFKRQGGYSAYKPPFMNNDGNSK